MLSIGQAIFQGSYFIIFFAMAAEIAGAFDLGVTPRINWGLFAVVLFLNLGKLIYWIKKGRF